MGCIGLSYMQMHGKGILSVIQLHVVQALVCKYFIVPSKCSYVLAIYGQKSRISAYTVYTETHRVIQWGGGGGGLTKSGI